MSPLEAGQDLVSTWIKTWTDTPPPKSLRESVSDTRINLLARHEVGVRFQEVYSQHGGDLRTADACLSIAIHCLEKAIWPGARLEDAAMARAWLELLVVLKKWPAHPHKAW